MKTHKIKYADTETFTTFCGLTDWNVKSEDFENNLVGTYDECTCANCIRAFNRFTREVDAYFEKSILKGE